MRSHANDDIRHAPEFAPACQLTTLDPILVKGSVLMFDEFYPSLREFRAFQDYISAFGRQLLSIGRALDAQGRVAFVLCDDRAGSGQD